MYIHVHAEHNTIDTVNVSKVSGEDEPDAAVIAGEREGDDSASADGEECVKTRVYNSKSVQLP